MALCLEWTRSWLNFAAYMLTLFSYFAPWNSTTTLEVASQHPVAFRPANYAYSIYGVIYLSLAIFIIWQLVPSNHDQRMLKDIGFWFVITCLFQSAWVPLFSYGYFDWAGLLMIFVFLSLARVNAGLHRVSNLQRLPFTLWFGWVTVAVFVSLSTVLVYVTRAKIFQNPMWDIALILVTGTLSVFWLRFTGEFGFPIAITWAAFGIAVANYSNTISVCALSTGIFLTMLMLISVCFHFLNTKRVVKRKRSNDETIQVEVEVQPPKTEPPAYMNFPIYQTPRPVYTCYWPTMEQPFAPAGPPPNQ